MPAVQTVLAVVTESLHGAIVADALLVPWIPVRSTSGILESKWRDWCASLDLRYVPRRVLPVRPLWRNPTLFRRTKHRVRLRGRRRVAADGRAHARPVRSDDAVLASRIEALRASLERLKADLQAHV